MLERPHVVEAVRELDEDDPEVVRHREEHLAERLGLLGLARGEGVLPDLRDAVDEVGHVGSEELGKALFRERRVLEDVVQETRCDRRFVQLHLREDHRDVQRMDEVGLARGAKLVAVPVRRDDVRAAQQVLVQPRVVGLDLLEDVLEAQHGPIIGAPRPFRLISPPSREPRWISSSSWWTSSCIWTGTWPTSSAITAPSRTSSSS